MDIAGIVFYDGYFHGVIQLAAKKKRDFDQMPFASPSRNDASLRLIVKVSKFKKLCTKLRPFRPFFL
ncbi:MAG: hypothetical protein ACJA2C_001309 [Marinoscillum sp.]